MPGDIICNLLASNHFKRSQLFLSHKYTLFQTNYLCTGIINIVCITADLNHPQTAVLEFKQHLAVIHIAQIFQKFMFENCPLCINFCNLTAHKPAGNIEIMNSHIHKQSSRLGYICRRRAIGVTLAVMNIDGLSTAAGGNLLLCGNMTWIKTAHESNLKI